MNMRGLPGMLAPRYQELQVRKTVRDAAALTCSTQAASAGVAGLDGRVPVRVAGRRCNRRSSPRGARSTTMTLVKAEVLPGPAMLNRFGKAGDHQAQVVQRPGAPLVLDAQAAAAAQVQPHHRAGHGVEAGGQHQGVEFVAAAAGAQAAGVIALDRLPADVHQLHVRPVEGLVVAAVHAQPLAADGVRGRQQARRCPGRARCCGSCRARTRPASALARSSSSRSLKAPRKLKPPMLPARFERRFALLRRGLQRRHRVGRQQRAEAAVHAPVALRESRRSRP